MTQLRVLIFVKQTCPLSTMSVCLFSGWRWLWKRGWLLCLLVPKNEIDKNCNRLKKVVHEAKNWMNQKWAQAQVTAGCSLLCYVITPSFLQKLGTLTLWF